MKIQKLNIKEVVERFYNSLEFKDQGKQFKILLCFNLSDTKSFRLNLVYQKYN